MVINGRCAGVAVPQLSKVDNSAIAKRIHPDALQNQLKNLLVEDTVRFSLIFTLADDTDEKKTDNPLAQSERRDRTLVLYQLTLESTATGQCAQKNLNPLVLTDVNMKHTPIPILRA